MKNDRNIGSTIIITVIGIALLLISVIGTTFAYFTVIIRGNPSDTNVRVQSMSLGIINFEHGNTISYTDVIPGRPKWDNIDEAKNIIRFSLTSSTSMDRDVTVGYNVYFNITKDTFESDNIVYLTTATPGAYSKEAKMKYGNELDEYKTSFIPYENGIPLDDQKIDVGYIPKEYANQDVEQKILIGSGNIGGLASRDEWSFEIWINEIGVQQNYDQGRIIEGYITAEVTEIPYVTNEPEKIN